MLLYACALVCCAVLSAGPVVAKVDPPSWWSGHSMNPVRLLVEGSDLSGATIEAPAGFRASNLVESAGGAYLFVDVAIPRSAPPGPARLRLRTRQGTTEIPFSILPQLPRQGRFQGFGPDDLIYLIMPDRFADGDPSNNDPVLSHGLFNRDKPRYYHGGDFQGIIDHLPYLKDLGVTAVWLNPVYDNANCLNRRETYRGEPVADYHGYGPVDFYAVDEHFGDVIQFRKLVESAHRLGIKVIQDQIANHTSPYHRWVVNPPSPTWFHGTERSHLVNTWQIWTIADPHSSAASRRSTLEGWFAGVLPDLNQDNPEVARYLIQNTLWWIGVSGIDGIRQDTLPYAPRTFWRDWMAAIKREYPKLRVAGEVFHGDASLVSFFQGGAARWDGIDSGIDALFDFPMYCQLRRAAAPAGDMRELGVALSHDWLYANPDMLVTFLGLHDVTRFMSENGASIHGLKLAFDFLLTARGIPMIYYGDEIAMQGGPDPDNRRDFPGGFPGDRRNAFTASGRTADESAVFEHVRKLAHLRAQNPCLRAGDLSTVFAGGHAYAYVRRGSGCTALIALNNSRGRTRIHAPADMWTVPKATDALGGEGTAQIRNGQLFIDLPPRAGAVFLAH
jgi:glycosidase